MSNNINLANIAPLSIKINKDYDAQPPYFFALDATDRLENATTQNGVIVEMDNSYMSKSNMQFVNNTLAVQTMLASSGGDDASPFNGKFITKFYMGSITVVGLYIFYRMLLKNK